jgi:hypothetical protein
MRCNVVKVLRLLAFLTALGLTGAVQADYPEQEGTGYIESIDLDASTLIVNGLRFRVGTYVKVTIDGSFGAFTLLHEGMLIHYDYYSISRTEREIFRIETRPPDEHFESS